MKMYVPPLNSLLRRLDLKPTDFGAGRVAVPTKLLKLLVQLVLANGEFNEAGYLKANPDIDAAVRDGSIESAFMHYVSFGYFEGRLGATPEVDEKWYLRAYPDIADGVEQGTVASAREHFDNVGAGEGRSPNANYATVAAQWKNATAVS